jgi:hypothetical protein
MSMLLNPILNNKFYNSDIESKMNKIELQQANQNFNKPEYLKQFDDLRFDNISEPTSINDIYKTNSGVNSVFENNIYFENGYSNFQNQNTTYNIVGENDFTHNNMIPATSRRDFPTNTRRCESKLETFTGNFTNYTPKTEKVPLFAPVANLTHVNGVPTITSKLQNRYLPSNKNNLGNLPFENKVRVKPGLDGKVQEGKYSVYRVNPKNVDELRSDINKKVSYNNKPLETKKLGDIRAPDFNLTKYKLPDFKIKEFSDLLPTKSEFDAPKQTGVFTNVISQRGEEEKYIPGPAINSNKGDAPNTNTSLYENAKKESYLNDPSHGVYEVSNKPVMTNAKSYENNVTNRATTNSNYEGPLNGGSSYAIDYNNKAKDTIKQSLINGNTITSAGGLSTSGYIATTDIAKKTIREDFNYNVVLNASAIEKQPTVYNKDIAKRTIRENTENTKIIGNIKSNNIDSTYVRDINNVAKNTIRQDTENTQNIGHASNSTTESTYIRDFNNIAKNTLRQDTENTQYIGTINNSSNDSTYTRDLNETARKTIRQDTGNTQNIGTVKSNNIDSSYIRDYNNVAKDTIKQTTLLQGYKGIATGAIQSPPTYEAANNMHLNECRETVSMFNRAPNGKADLHGPTINKENVVLVEPLLYSYTPNPILQSDNLTPRVSEDMIRNVYAKAKPVFESSSYYITNNRINTLNNNPLVNDLYHQKNY